MNLPQPIPEVARVLRVVEFPPYCRAHNFLVEAEADPPLGLPVHCEVSVQVPWDVYIVGSATDAEQAFRRALVHELPDDFFPTWAPI